MVGAWSVNSRHAVVSDGAGWRYIASSEHLSGPRPGKLAGSSKAGVAGSNPAGVRQAETTGLCELIDAIQTKATVEWEAHNLDPAHLPPDAGVAAETLADTLELPIIQMRLATATAPEAFGEHEELRQSEPLRARAQFVQCASET